MIPKECKRLAEVDFPIAVVSKHSAREKSMRDAHPSVLHLWWARRPLAACRAMLLALLLPDPCDEHCPADFRARARELFAETPFVAVRPGSSDLDLRQALLQFIGDFANWDVCSQQDFLAVGRGLVQAAHPEETPLVVDPFAGGGSIPLEALRLGCDAFASDLNPVAGLILKVMLQNIPRHGPELADDLRQAGAEVKATAEGELAEFYPPDPDGAQPIAYLWARTVRCESPNCGAEIPLVRSFWLAKKAGRMWALRPRVVRSEGNPPEVRLDIFEPENEGEVRGGTISRAKATCLCCNMVLPAERVRSQLHDQRGGADAIFDAGGHRIGGARMTAVVMLKPGRQGRCYRSPDDADYEAVHRAACRLAEIKGQSRPDGLSPVPDEPLPPVGTLGLRVQRYGMLNWGDLFSARQKIAILSLTSPARAKAGDGPLGELLAFCASKCTDLGSSLSLWKLDRECPVNTCTRHALPMVWDYAEAVVTSGSSGSFESAVDRIAESIGPSWPCTRNTGLVQIADATQSPLPSSSSSVWFTDPPYYDAIPYADLSDFFFVWLKRGLPFSTTLRDPFDLDNPLTPKHAEIVQDTSKMVAGRRKDAGFFEEAMRRSFAEGRRVLQDDGIGCVVFAHKTTEGWEALLSGLIGGNWTVTASWPLATELASRLRAQRSAALATSVHLVCRPRPADAPVGDWADVLRELPRRVGDWMERLQSEGVRGADLVFACIGPALEIYSRYSRVETAEGCEVPLGGDPESREPQLRGFLAYVWEVIGRSALEQVLGTAEAKARNGAAGALEEDARLTALFLWTLQSTANEDSKATKEDTDDSEADDDEDEEGGGTRSRAKGFSLAYDVARRFAQPLGIHLEEWEGRVIETSKGVVRLLAVSERAKQLFGEDGAQAVAHQIEQDAARSGDVQMTLFPDEAPTVRGRRRTRGHAGAIVSDGDLQTTRAATTLDRIHAAMLLQAGGRTNALRALLRAEVDRGSDFVRLANSLSALYPTGSEEKRLLDAMLLAVPR